MRSARGARATVSLRDMLLPESVAVAVLLPVVLEAALRLARDLPMLEPLSATSGWLEGPPG
ncbi:MAG TPA: hypothetical protein VFC14_04615 [Burkholderiales bacterium]|nr:hypothetical protein [Burkholderiales bacterium]